MKQDRTSADFWKRQREHFVGLKPIQRSLRHYIRFAHGFAGSNRDVPFAGRPGRRRRRAR